MDDQRQQYEEHVNSMIAIFNEKLEHINSTLTSILLKLDKNDEEFKQYIVEIANLKNKDANQQKEIDDIKRATEDNKKWWLGILSALVVSMIIYILNSFGLKL